MVAKTGIMQLKQMPFCGIIIMKSICEVLFGGLLMEKKVENILYSLLPLLLILAIPWLLRLLSSAKRGPAQPSDTGEKARPGGLLGNLIPGELDERPDTSGTPGQSQPVEPYRAPMTTSVGSIPSSGPPVTPKPIKPKWWGA